MIVDASEIVDWRECDAAPPEARKSGFVSAGHVLLSWSSEDRRARDYVPPWSQSSVEVAG